MSGKRRLLIALGVVLNLLVVLAVVERIQEAGKPPPYEPPTGPVYIAMGDSYAQGFMNGGDLDHGFADLVTERLAEQGTTLSLVNFACGGGTIRAMLVHPGCAFPARQAVAPPYPDVSQVAAVERFAASYPGTIELITISIGGNDVSVCANAENPLSCGFAVIATLATGLTEVLTRLRAAVGPDVPIIGTTYPNTMLGQWVHEPVNRQAAAVSTRLYSDVFNPQLKLAYEAAGATFVDITQETGGYGPLTNLTTLDPYGEIPASVAAVCQLTRVCDLGDIHPTEEGYSVIANQILDVVPARLGGGGD